MAKRWLLALAGPLLLAGCFLFPGDFEAEMVVDADGGFRFAYLGELQIGPDDSEKYGDPADGTATGEEDADFGASIETGIEELARQLMGGLDPRDEESVRAFAAGLEGRQGWNRVDYLGTGRFDVDYAQSGRLDRDFVFPLVPDFALNFPMFAATPLDDGTVRISVPALMPPPAEERDAASQAEMDEIMGQGVFVLRTTAELVSTNGTPRPGDRPGETVIRWTSDDPRSATPEAVLRFTEN